MNITNKLLLSIIVFSLGLIVIGIIGLFTDNRNLDVTISAGEFLFTFTAISLLIKNGTFIKSPEYKYVKLGISVSIIGVLFKIMHWPFSAEILAVGFVSFSILYLYHLIKNNRTRWSGFLTLFFILTLSFGRLFKIFHWPYSEEISVIGMIALFILIIDLIKTRKFYIDEK